MESRRSCPGIGSPPHKIHFSSLSNRKTLSRVQEVMSPDGNANVLAAAEEDSVHVDASHSKKTKQKTSVSSRN